MDGKIDKFWTDDIFILVNPDRLTEFWVSEDMHDIEKLNAITRFSIYVSIILSLYNKNPKYFVITFVCAIITFFINKYSLQKFNCPENFETEDEDKITINDKKKFRTPTLNNPYMNSTVYDLQDPKKRKRAIPYPNNSEKSIAVKKEIENKFTYGIPDDYNDIYGINGGQRDFYTMPAEFTDHDKNDESRIFFFGNIDSKKSTAHTFSDGIYIDYGRM